MNTQRVVRTSIEVPSALWSKVRIEKIVKKDESVNDVVIRALKRYFEVT